MSSTRAVGRSLRLLELAAQHPAGFPHARAVALLGIAKVQVTRLLAGLCAEDMLRKDPGSGLYLPGPRLRTLLAQDGAERRLIQLVAPALPDLAERCGNGVALMHWNGHHAICLASEQVSGGFRVMRPGHVVGAPHRTPWGLFLLPRELWSDLTRDDPAAQRWYRQERRRLQQQGYTCSIGTDRNRLGAPLWDDSGLCIGALTVVDRPDRLDRQHIRDRTGPALVAVAARCSRAVQAA
ncbi:MAG: hypothetical protein ACOCXJ_04555 [Planctomycetota bacterium]